MPGGYYHVHTRGNDGQAISFGSWSGRLFVRELERASLRHRWRVLAYCLMTNHYHAVFQLSEDAVLSKGMEELNGRFAVISNSRLKRRDHLFGRRFTSHLIESDSYLLESIRYTVLNPVRAHLVSDPGRWRASSLRFCLGYEKPPRWLDVDWVLGNFGATPERGLRLFKEFVAGGIDEPLPPVPGTGGSPPDLSRG